MSDRWMDDESDQGRDYPRGGGRYVRNDDLDELGRGGRPRRLAVQRGYGPGRGVPPNDTPPAGYGSRQGEGRHRWAEPGYGQTDYRPNHVEHGHLEHEKRSWFSPDVSDQSFEQLYRQGREGQRDGPPLKGYGEHRGKGPRNFRRTDERIMEDLNERLTDDDRLDASDIEVACTGGDVTLNGTVASKADKRRAEDIADSVGGVGHVQNNLRVAETIR